MTDTKIRVAKRDIIMMARAYFDKDEAMFKLVIENFVRAFQKNGDEDLADFLNMMIDEHDRVVPM